MALSKYSTGDSFMPVNPEVSRVNLNRSVMISESMINSRLHKVVSNEDHRIDSVLVRATYKNLPATEASRMRDLMVKE